MKLDSVKRKKIEKYFETKPVLEAYVFGSYARGDADEKSDVDILIELDYSKKIGLKFLQMKIDLENILESHVDLVSARGISKYMKPLIDKEKQRIYAR